MLIEIVPRLFVGNMAAFLSKEELIENGIESVISVVGGDLLSVIPDCVKKHVQVPITDEAESDLLSFLPPCMEFISSSLFEQEYNVLVHCQAGISRSVAVILAYLIYSKQYDSLAHAFRAVKKVHKQAKPNEGFVEQLKLFVDMGCKVDESYDAYRLYRLQHVAVKGAMDGYAEAALSVLGRDPTKLTERPSNPITTTIKCKKCRRLLMLNLNLLSHEPGQGQLSFKYHRREPGMDVSCSSLFCEPLEWMNGVCDGEVEGKILCPKCDFRLGTFNWSGGQCSCGGWITPCFQIQKSRVDVLELPQQAVSTNSTTTITTEQ
eukprot:m.16740 g.16740  ORF g.16740 m.16740 type:complete len:320 (+) comp4662_c0_seq4:305-1264(+)